MKKISVFTKILIILFLIIIIFFIVIPLFMKLSQKHENVDSQDLYDNETDDITDGTVTGNPIEYTAQAEVPEYIANRGIILLGTDYDFIGGRLHSRYDTNGERLWADGYICDCDLKVESSDEEFHEFCNRFSEFGEIRYTDDGYGEVCIVRIPYYAYPDVREWEIDITRSCTYPFNASEGGMWVTEEASCLVPIYYDPSGKYIFVIGNSTLDSEYFLYCLEPSLTSVDIYSSDFGNEIEYHSDDAGEVRAFVDAIHELRLTEVEEARPELAMAENYTVLSFTDKNGYTNEYTIVGRYLIHGEDVYYVDNPDGLQVLIGFVETLPEPEESSELPENDEE